MTQRYHVRDFYEAAKAPKDLFVQQYTYPFLVWLGKEKKNDEAGEDEFYTTVVKPPVLQEKIAIAKGEMLDPDFAVFPLVKRTSVLPGAKPTSSVIMVGRASNTDVVLPFSGISKSHFYIAPDALNADSYVIVDSDSTNGTKVNDDLIPSQTRVPLDGGDTITLGTEVVLRFFPAPDFWEILQRHPSNFD